MLQLLSRYTSQHSRVCIVHLALTLSNPAWFAYTRIFFNQTSNPYNNLKARRGHKL